MIIVTQIGLAVGDTQKVEEKASLTYLSLLVMHIHIIDVKYFMTP